MSENGPYEIIETCTDVWVNGPGIDTSLDALTIEFLNTAYSEGCKSRDSEVSSLTSERDALKDRVKELEEQVKELTFHRDQLIQSTPCPRCGHPALFVCWSGSLNCGCCGVHVGWDALTRHGG